KYINHSCRPNVLSTGFGFDISIDEIHEDEQLLTDYACLNLESSFFCKCSSLHCRKTISSSNLQDLIKQWDKKIRSVFHLLNQQPQPLWDLIPNQEEIQFYMQNIDKIPSSAQNLTPENYNLGPYQSIR
ncbi:MAG: hypothetical protein KDK51_09510, partial [Deltaproteobacteria bacterium]|nr:hypothetical protein [Deltaproteobacteria bacterium]